MTQVLEKLSMSEVLGYISPGVALLASLALWIHPGFNSGFWDQQIIVGVFALLLSYTGGWVIASFNQMAIIRYSDNTPRRGTLRKILITISRVIYWFPSPRHTSETVVNSIRIDADMELLTGTDGRSTTESPWDRLVVYRCIKSDQLKSLAESRLREAENFYRRYLFSMGMAVAILLVAIQVTIRLFADLISCARPDLYTWCSHLPGSFFLVMPDANYLIGLPIPPFWSLFIIVFGLFSSFELRRIAFRMWELETYLTSRLAPEPP